MLWGGKNRRLIEAAAAGDLDEVMELVEKGADVNAKDKDGWTPLHYAASNGYLDVVKFLVENGADVDAEDKDSQTPLHVAAFFGHLDVVKFLVKNGAYVNAMDNDGQTPLHVAASNGHLDVVKFLVKNGADVNAKDKDGQTPLHKAAYFGHLSVAKFLVEHGADINAKDKNGWTPLHYAALFGHLDIVKLLIENGADVDAEDKIGQTPLNVATPEVRRVLKSLIKEARSQVNQQRVNEAIEDNLMEGWAKVQQMQRVVNVQSPQQPPVQRPSINAIKEVGSGLAQDISCWISCNVYSPINDFLASLDRGLSDKDLQDLRETLVEVRGYVKGIWKHLLEVHDEENARIMSELYDMLVNIIELINVASLDRIDEAELRSRLIEVKAYIKQKGKDTNCECK